MAVMIDDAQEGNPALPGEAFFSFSSDDPWSWMPVEWIHSGAVFVALDGHFYRLVRAQERGWWCEPVLPKTIGPQARLSQIRRIRLDYGTVVQTLEELRQKPTDEVTSPKITAETDRLKAKRQRLRYELARLCNPRAARSREPGIDPERTKKWLLYPAAAGFVVALASGIVTISGLHPAPRKSAFIFLFASLALLVISGALLILVPVLFDPNSQRGQDLLRRFRPSGNLVGCLGLLLLLIIVLAAIYIGAALIWHYRGIAGG